MKLLSKLNFDTIFKIFQIIAVCYLVYKVFHQVDGSKRIDAIEQAQQEIKKAQQEILAADKARDAKYDSLQAVNLKKIDSLNTNLMINLNQVRIVQTKINNWRTIFEQNKVILPDPDKE